MNAEKLIMEFQMQPDGAKPCIAKENGDWVATVETKEQADELVRRYNAYDDLLEACEEIIEGMIAGTNSTNKNVTMYAIRMVEKANAKAKGQPDGKV